MSRSNSGPSAAARAIAVSLVLVAAVLVSPGPCQAQALGATGVKAMADTAWVPTGSMAMPRTGHTATLLPTGKVLVAGGDGAVMSAELYDPSTGTWSATGNLNIVRIGHTATLLPNGRVLVAGGATFTSLFDDEFPTGAERAELYDPATGTWSLTGVLHHQRQDHTATLLRNGKVLVAGGTVPDGTAEVYDPATGLWAETGDLSASRYRHTATLLDDGTVLVAGGSPTQFSCGALDSTELYDPVGGVWRLARRLPAGVERHTATLLANGSVLIAGGRRTACNARSASIGGSVLLDPANGWRSQPDDGFIARYGHTASLLSDGRVLVAGGSRSTSGSPATDGAQVQEVSTVCVEDFEQEETFCFPAGSWKATASLLTARTGHTATSLPNGGILIAGGESGGILLGTAELYAAPLSINVGYSGTWYDPAQSGHGILIQVLPDNRLLAWWFSFDPGGTQQAWFGGVGTYSGASATVSSVVQSTGGSWIPNLVASQVVNQPWGSLTFTFTDCNHGRVDFASVRGYGTGSMNLTRLTRPLGLSCP